MKPLIPRIIRNVALLTGVSMFIGGIAWHDVPSAVAVFGVVMVVGSVSSMVLAWRN